MHPPASTITVAIIGTGAKAAVGSEAGSSQAPYQREWQKQIDKLLFEWQCDPASLQDDDLPGPSLATIARAREMAGLFRDDNQPPPQRVCTDAEGGIVFERGSGCIFQSIRVRQDGKVEIVTFVDARLRSRVPIL
jgi:hypothetical protein